jgi:hypothetical protein|nr:MAG TPA: Intracellular proteinase inhibitor [Caudoviricetes sp.]
MVTKNYAKWGAGIYLTANVANIFGKICIKNIEGTVENKSYSTKYVSENTWKYVQSLFVSTSLRSLTTGEGTGMFLGTGNTPATQDDYKLENMIEFANDGLTVLSETLNHMVDDNTFYNYVLTVKNNSTEAITISESGMISKVNSFDINETFLWARDTFEPVTLEPGETRPFSMTIGLE